MWKGETTVRDRDIALGAGSGRHRLLTYLLAGLFIDLRPPFLFHSFFSRS